MNDDEVETVAIVIFATLADGGWGDGTKEWRECVQEVEAAWWARPEWERDDYRDAARQAITAADNLRANR
jgi:hypothetical protein